MADPAMGRWSYTYDSLNRLTSATGPYGALTYPYDPIGNLLQKESIPLTYGLPDGTKPHANLVDPFGLLGEGVVK